MAVTEKRICPLGSECRKNVGQETHVCAWLVTLAGENPQGGPPIDQDMCAMASLPLLLVQNAQMTRSAAAATEGLRNEVTKGNDAVFESLIRMPTRAPNLRIVGPSDEIA